MKLTEIKLSGFKSFAKPTSLHFDDGLTSIIGPNGSGKSNLAEAVRWVLGEQSAKQLRGSASTDVIFSGSPDQPKSNKASVSLIFDNESGRFPVEAATVSITRSLSRAGQSEYLLNNDAIRLIDLQQIIAEAGIGAKSYAVISQGTVDRYLTATPTKRRELFDEATGIKSLQIKLSQADSKLKQVDQHTHDLNTIINELEPRLRVLKRQAEKHAERETYAKEYEQKQTIWFHHAWKKSQSKIKKTKLQIEESKQLVHEKRKYRQQLEEKMLNFLQQNKSPIESIKQRLEVAEQKYNQEKATYEDNTHRATQLRLSIDEIKNSLQIAQTNLASVRSNSNSETWVKTIKNTLSQCLNLIGEIQDRRAITKDTLIKLSTDIHDAIKTVDRHSNIGSNRSSLAELEHPLQEVAKLKAILEERQQQLTMLPSLQTPSDNEIIKLQQLITNETSTIKSIDVTEDKRLLEAARTNEVAAERKEQAAEMVLEQAQNDLLNLKTNILREKGTLFLQEIQNSEEPGTEPPTEQELHQLSQKLATLGEVDALALKEYEEVAERYDHLSKQLQDILATKEHIEKLRQTLQRDMTTRFNEQLDVIKTAFAQYFTRLFGGGQAELKLEEEGIDILVCPPGKRMRHINLLSGGEKALTSLALLFAILEAQKPPFLVLDEVDAALDEANADRFAQALKEKSSHMQCIVITHNRQTMSQADLLYGVTMNKANTSKIYSVNLKEHDIAEQKIIA